MFITIHHRPTQFIRKKMLKKQKLTKKSEIKNRKRELHRKNFSKIEISF